MLRVSHRVRVGREQVFSHLKNAVSVSSSGDRNGRRTIDVGCTDCPSKWLSSTSDEHGKGEDGRYQSSQDEPIVRQDRNLCQFPRSKAQGDGYAGENNHGNTDCDDVRALGLGQIDVGSRHGSHDGRTLQQSWSTASGDGKLEYRNDV